MDEELHDFLFRAARSHYLSILEQIDAKRKEIEKEHGEDAAYWFAVYLADDLKDNELSS